MAAPKKVIVNSTSDGTGDYSYVLELDEDSVKDDIYLNSETGKIFGE